MAEPAYIVASDSETIGGEEKTSSSFQEIAIGVDIGTSQCSVAVWSGSHVELLSNTRSETLMRSYVTFKDDIPAGGVSSHLSHECEVLSGSAVFNIKRLIGRVDTDPVVHASKSLPFMVQSLNIGVRPFIAALVNNMWRSTTPEEVLAILLVELRVMVESQLKRPVHNVVLTIPVSFSRFQVTRVERACAMAGLQVVRLMPEPTAVALLYAQQQHDDISGGTEKSVVIFNMGAGYCDVAAAVIGGGVADIKALVGGTLGGEDILLNTMYHLLPDMDNHFSTRGIHEIKKMGLLRVATQDAIHKLSSQTEVHIEVDLGNGGIIDKVLDRVEFDEINRDIFEKCGSLIKRCLDDARLKAEDINDVILVGGCSNIPKLKNTITSICQRDVYAGFNPLEAAVRGAALEGAVASGISDPYGNLDLLTIQITPLSIGVRADGSSFVPIIHQNTTVPVQKDLMFTTTHDNQAEALIIVYEGDMKAVEQNHLLGYFKITGIPPATKGVPQINISMDINASNVLTVCASVGMPGNRNHVVPAMEVRMPMVDDGHGWCAAALNTAYGSSLDLMIKK